VDALHALGMQANIGTLNVILPVGVSFYTFQSISYTIEVYRREMRPVRDPIAYLAFVSFFPHMVAGPIMRAVDLLPQMSIPRRFTYANGVSGLRLIVQGLFKKVVIADSLAPMVDDVFRQYAWESGPDLMLGAIYFRLPDLWGLQWVQRHRDRVGEAVRDRTDDQLPYALPVP
jgi:alginate O-acetyltransferase complex protein AlgI